jgi:hypothetical protein
MRRVSMSIEPISFDVTAPKRERTSITLDATHTDRVSADHYAYFTQLEEYIIFILPAFPVRRPGIKSHPGRGIANYLGKPTDTRL